MDQGYFQTRKWPPGEWVFEAVWTPSFIGGLLAANHYGPDPRGITSTELIWFFAALLSMMAVETLAEFTIMRNLGTRPKFKFWVRGKPGIGSGWMATGHRLTRRQYAAIYSIPYLCAATVVGLYLTFAPVRISGLLLAVGCLLWAVRSLWYSALALRQPEGTLIEERPEGSLLHQPQPSFSGTDAVREQ